MPSTEPNRPSRRYPSQSRPISRVEMRLTGDRCYECAIEEAVAWIVRHAGVRIDRSAFGGTPFSTGADARAPVEAQKMILEGKDHWFFRLYDPDESVGARRWDAGAVIRRDEDGATILVSLDVLLGGGDLAALKRQLRFRRSVPGLVRQLAERIDCRVGSDPVTPFVTMVADQPSYDAFIGYVFGGKRSLPAIVYSLYNGRESELTRLATDVATKLTGIARCFVLSDEYAWKLTEDKGRKWSVFMGAVRIYQPAMDFQRQDAHFEHAVFLRNRSEEFLSYADDLIKSSTTLRHSLPSVKAAFHQFYARQIDSGAEAEGKADLAALSRELELLKDKHAELTADFEGAEGLLMDAEKFETDATRRLRQLEEENAELKLRVDHLSDELSSAEQQLREAEILSYRYLTRYEIEDPRLFEQWSESVLHPYVRFTSRALDGLSDFDNVTLDDGYLPRLSQAFFAIRDVVLGANPTALGEHYRGWQIEVTRCFANRNDIKNFPAYEITVDGTPKRMEWHAKWGRDADIRSAFRIYFHWDEDQRLATVGHLPGHLSNKLTRGH